MLSNVGDVQLCRPFVMMIVLFKKWIIHPLVSVKCVWNKLERKRTTSEMMGTAEEGGDTIEWIDEKLL